ncbi:MAG: hypothetical protein ACRBBN_12470 [Methyloligellaceae bacterium]
MSVDSLPPVFPLKILWSQLKHFLTKQRTHAVLKTVSDRVCSIQKKFLDAHHAMSSAQLELHDYISTTEESELQDQKLFDLLQALLVETDSWVEHVKREVERGFIEYYEIIKRTDDIMPRVCVKGIDHQGMVYDMSRRANESVRKSFFYDENTAFIRCRGGDEFVCRDIPKQAKKERYFNNRLNKIKVEGYKPIFFLKRWWQLVSSEEPYEDDNWEECWDVDCEQKDSDSRSYYKSTLVIPITTTSSTIRREVLKELVSIGDEPAFRALGFICLDHVKTNFFKKTDRLVGWIYADILSEAIVHKNIFSDSSPSYVKALEKLYDLNFDLYIDLTGDVSYLDDDEDKTG